jgi:hypothetical protein
MKLLLIFTATLLLTLGCGQNDKSGNKETSSANKGETSPEKKNEDKPANRLFDIKAYKIVFNYTGGPSTGTETFYFDDYGEVAVLVADKKTQYDRTRQTTIWKDKSSTIIDHEKKIVSKSPFRPRSTEPEGIAALSPDAKKGIGYERMADETIAGKTCEVWFNAKANIKYWFWNKIALKLSNQGAYTKEATTVEEINAIPAELMEIPKDYKM